MNKAISEGVVQGILVAAIGFSAATVWKNFNDSTDELKIAKKQIETQIETNELLKGFNAQQKKTNQSLLSISEKQNDEIKELTASVAYLNEKIEQLSKKASVKTDKTVVDKLGVLNQSIQASDLIRSQVKQQQQQQQQFQGQIQEQQQRQQQQQQAWY